MDEIYGSSRNASNNSNRIVKIWHTEIIGKDTATDPVELEWVKCSELRKADMAATNMSETDVWPLYQSVDTDVRKHLEMVVIEPRYNSS